jgi:hypothetical protein
VNGIDLQHAHLAYYFQHIAFLRLAAARLQQSLGCQMQRPRRRQIEHQFAQRRMPLS